MMDFGDSADEKKRFREDPIAHFRVCSIAISIELE
jgi:hypothetical protein